MKIIKYKDNDPEILKATEKAKIIVADLDGTLAVSKSPIDSEMSKLIAALLGLMDLAVISGGNYGQFEKQFVGMLNCGEKELSRLYLFPTNATAFYRMNASSWKRVYAEQLTKKEKLDIISAINQAMSETNLIPNEHYGDVIEDRFTQITFSALGQNAPIELKSKWDPDRKKREVIKKLIEKRLKGFQIAIGGTTSIDISRKGIDKGYGIKKITEVLGYKKGEMLYVGDSLFKGGNDYPAAKAGVTSISVGDVNDTKSLFKSIISSKLKTS
ncbi:MAG: HAD-IIB family hydrolase [Candidatus Marsarchaeota archaeon]|nr:HAD-IIB family hydrolase [Candidatus Marsarchaeota archaeon]